MVPGEDGINQQAGGMSRVAVALAQMPVRLYRLLVSPLLGPNCRFHPSCSVYALEALEKHGVFKGLYLTARRLLRCHPWSGCGGHDPVP